MPQLRVEVEEARAVEAVDLDASGRHIKVAPNVRSAVTGD